MPTAASPRRTTRNATQHENCLLPCPKPLNPGGPQHFVSLNMGNYVSVPVAHADDASLMPPAAAAAATEPTPTKVRDRESLGMPADASETDRLHRRTLGEAGRSSASRAPRAHAGLWEC